MKKGQNEGHPYPADRMGHTSNAGEDKRVNASNKSLNVSPKESSPSVLARQKVVKLDD